MQVLICIPCLLTGGTEIQTLNLAQALIDGGHSVTVVCYFEHSADMVQRFLSSGCNVICLSKDGIRIHGWKGILFLYKGLKKCIRNIHPDVGHIQYMAPGAIPIFLLKLLGVKRIIATTHTFADIYPNLRLIHFIQRHCVRVFTCITKLAEESYFGTSNLYDPTYKLGRRNHFTIYNSLPKSFSAEAPIGKTFKKPITIGVVSRLATIKGMDLVIPAFDEIMKKHPESSLIIVGAGNLKEKMIQQASESHCQNKITWAGRQKQEDLGKWYSKMDIVLMPSRSEGFGLTAIEAMSYGCVVVAAKTGGLPEVVKENKTGLLHTPGSVQDIADKVCSLIDNPDIMFEYSKNAITEVTKFSFEHYCELINDLYNKLK